MPDKIVVIVVNTLIPSAINKLVMRDVYRDYENFDKKFILINSPKRRVNKKWFDVFYSKAKGVGITYVPFFFAKIRNAISVRFLGFTKLWDIKIALTKIILSNAAAEVLIVNYDFRRDIPQFKWLSRTKKIQVLQEIHSLDTDLSRFQSNEKRNFVFANEYQIDHYIKAFPVVVHEHNYLLKRYKPLPVKDYLAKLDYSKIEPALSIQSIRAEVANYIGLFKVKIVFFGRFVDGKGLKELCEVVEELKTDSVGLALIGMSSPWFEQWKSELEGVSNIRNFGGPFIDVERVLDLFDFNVLLSESEIGPLTIFEAIPFGLRTIVRDRPYAHQIQFKNHVIMVDDNDVKGSLRRVLTSRF